MGGLAPICRASRPSNGLAFDASLGRRPAVESDQRRDQLMVRRILCSVGRAMKWVASVLTQTGGAANGGRSADPSARSLYEDRKDYRP